MLFILTDQEQFLYVCFYATHTHAIKMSVFIKLLKERENTLDLCIDVMTTLKHILHK